MPVVDMLEAYAQTDLVRFHMPGHKGTLAFPAAWDVTEVWGTDDLHAPEGAIWEAQVLAAQAFGAARTWFLVNGSSCGVMAMLLALPKDRPVLVARDCHKAALHGLVLSGLRPVWILPGDLTAPQVLEKMLKTHKASALLMTRPDYYGRCSDIAAIAQRVHAQGARLLVDEAHGAHFAFSPLLPVSAAAYADAWVQSAHKTLPALTQSAYLHVSEYGRAFQEQLAQACVMLQSSSPSYMLMAGLDYARAHMQAQGADALAALVAACKTFEAHTPGAWASDGVTRDPTRLVVETGDGWACERWLRGQGIQVEMADHRRVVAIATVCDPLAHIALLSKRMAQWQAMQQRAYDTAQENALACPPIPEAQMTPREAAFASHRRVPLAAAAGRVCAVALGCYPPGIPAVMPGERIPKETVEQLTTAQAQSARLFGVRDGLVEIVG